MIPGAIPFSQEPLSSIPASEDVSFPNPLTALLSDPRARFAFVARANVYDPDTAARKDVYISSGGYATMGDGASLAEGIPNHTPFPAALISPYSVKVSMISGGTWEASSVPGFGAVKVAISDGRLVDYLRYDWEGATLTVWTGPYSWIGPSFNRFGKIFNGTIESAGWDDEVLTLNIRDLRHVLEAEANPEAYLGFGVAARLRASGDKVTVAHNTAIQPAGVLAYEVMYQPESPMRQGVIATKGGTAGWLVMAFADGAVGLFDRGLTNYVVTPPGVLDPDKATRVSVFGSVSGLAIHINGEVKARNAVTYGAPGNTSNLIMGALS